MSTRQEMMARNEETTDLLIIGGGITGAGAARDAIQRGLRVTLVEQNDLASGTSSRSSKLVHGGLRYLEQRQFSLVFEAVTERRILMDIAPHLVNPMGFVFPVYNASRRGVFTVNLGMWVYDGLSLFRSPKIHRNLSPKEVAEAVPQLKMDGLKGAPLYYDCSTDDARLTLETTLDAAGRGARIMTYTKVVGLLRGPKGRIVGARVRDHFTGEESNIKAGAVINATGPWTDRTRALGVGGTNRLRPTKGIHIVIDAARLSIPHAVVSFHPKDGRVLFAIPWGDRTYIGTTDTDFSDDPSKVCADASDVAYLLEVSNYYFPDAQLTTADVISTWAGVRPLISENANETGESATESQVSREHEIFVDSDGLITIAGGKLTTYRKMAAELVDRAIGMLMLTGQTPERLRPGQTHNEPLPGAVGWPANDDHDQVTAMVLEASNGSVSKETAALLGRTYGMRGIDVARMAATDPALAEPMTDERPEIMAQVDYAVKKELAATVRDILIRRTQLFFRDRDQGLNASEKVAQRMGELLGWDDQRITEENLAYQEEVGLSRRWREH